MDHCEQALYLLSTAMDEPLQPQQEQWLCEHLTQCADCRTLETELTGLHTAFPFLEELQAPAGVCAGVMDRIHGQAKAKRITRLRRPQFRALAGLAACGVLCVGLYQGGVRFTASQPPEHPLQINGVVLAPQEQGNGLVDVPPSEGVMALEGADNQPQSFVAPRGINLEQSQEQAQALALLMAHLGWQESDYTPDLDHHKLLRSAPDGTGLVSALLCEGLSEDGSQFTFLHVTYRETPVQGERSTPEKLGYYGVSLTDESIAVLPLEHAPDFT